jgi:hypothetical protein
MSPTLEKKVASILLALEHSAARQPTPGEIRQVLDDPELAAWLTECRNKGWGNANIFTMGR